MSNEMNDVEILQLRIASDRKMCDLKNTLNLVKLRAPGPPVPSAYRRRLCELEQRITDEENLKTVLEFLIQKKESLVSQQEVLKGEGKWFTEEWDSLEEEMNHVVAALNMMYHQRQTGPKKRSTLHDHLLDDLREAVAPLADVAVPEQSGATVAGICRASSTTRPVRSEGVRPLPTRTMVADAAWSPMQQLTRFFSSLVCPSAQEVRHAGPDPSWLAALKVQHKKAVMDEIDVVFDQLAAPRVLPPDQGQAFLDLADGGDGDEEDDGEDDDFGAGD
jgi:hypothetical protein